MFTDSFITGNYQNQINSYNPTSNEPMDIVSTIGSYSFLGQKLEALAIFHLHKKKFNKDQLCCCYFFISILLIRKSQFKEATGYITKIKNELKNNKLNSELNFFYYQSYSIFFFYIGNYKKALKLSIRAYKFSLTISKSSTYYRTLASDLLGHCYIKNKNLFLGLKMLETAHQFAKIIKNKSFANALEISVLIYKSQNGIDYKNLIEDLTTQINSVETEDSYSKINLNLELAYIFLMQGSFNDSKNVLDSIFPALVASENKRQILIWSLTNSFLNLFMNETNQAQNSLNLAKTLILSVKDQELQSKLNLQNKLTNELKFHFNSNSKDSKIQSHDLIKSYFQNHYQLFSDESSLKRDFLEFTISPDPLKYILNNKIYIWLYCLLPIENKKTTIVYSVKYKIHFILNSKSIKLYPHRLSKQILKLLILFQDKKNLSKPEIFEKVWEMKYAKRHDAIIYSLIKKIRSHFKSIGYELILNSEKGYKTSTTIEVINIDNYLNEKNLLMTHSEEQVFKSSIFYNDSQQLFIKNLAQPPLNNESKPVTNNINTNIKLKKRQLIFLSHLASVSKYEFNIYDYRIFCQVSNMSAYRDIVDLLVKNVVTKSGFGKRTKYLVIRGF